MKKIILALMLMVSFTVNASLICPSPTITCNYDEGTCDQSSGWHISGEGMGIAFPNVFELYSITAIKMPFPDDSYGKYKFACRYLTNSTQPRQIHQSVVFYAFANTLSGENWVFSWFGKMIATCSNISDPTTCTGD